MHARSAYISKKGLPIFALVFYLVFFGIQSISCDEIFLKSMHACNVHDIFFLSSYYIQSILC